MVRAAKDWRWSSYRATAGLEDAPGFLTVGWILAQFDSVPESARIGYREFVRQGRGIEIWDELRHGCLLGTDAFEAGVAPLLSEQRSAIDFPRSQRLAARPSFQELFSSVSVKATRNARIHEAMRVHEYTLKELAAYQGLR